MGVGPIEAALEDILKEYSDEFQHNLEKACKSVANDCANELKQTSPSGDSDSDHYKDGWMAVKESVGNHVNYTVANQNKPGLTHLLANGHVVSNGHGSYGRTQANPHIANAEQKYVSEYLRRIDTEL